MGSSYCECSNAIASTVYSSIYRLSLFLFGPISFYRSSIVLWFSVAQLYCHHRISYLLLCCDLLLQMDMESRSNLGDSSSSCALCHRILSSDNEADELDDFSVCGDCKFLFLEYSEPASPSPQVYHRRRGVSRRRFVSSESMESMFSHQFSQMISLARQNPSNDDAHSVDGVRSRRWRRFLSDTESDGFDSLYVESESNASFRRYRAVHDSDSDDAQTELDSDNDIDPMNAGTFQWKSEDDSEGEAQPNVLVNWRRQLLSRIQAPSGDLLTNLEESYVGNSGDYLDARGFEDLLDHLAENESSRRGAPPASLSYISNLPYLTINGDKQQQECAICKESFTLGAVVNQLPCLHLYHPSCILPWLAARNTCPLCRYELPTDHNERSEIVDEHYLIDDTSVDDDAVVDHLEVDAGAGDAPRNRWFFVAAPIVSIIGISLILWFGDSSATRLCPTGTGRPLCRRDNNHRRWWSFL
ncbi:RING-type E3 ubiquitin transferase [Salvia divinorum]|uniref:RING-type E3 ubiquitin transferase n=1 Tax=Salvia divinorum TaxID=28513 RepID=A0ABD1GY00_SALDI